MVTSGSVTGIGPGARILGTAAKPLENPQAWFPTNTELSAMTVVGGTQDVTVTITGGFIAAAYPSSDHSYAVNIEGPNVELNLWGGVITGALSVHRDSDPSITVHGKSICLVDNRVVGVLCDNSYVDFDIKDQEGRAFVPDGMNIISGDDCEAMPTCLPLGNPENNL